MSKKKRTKQQKIVASLKRQLKQQKVVYSHKTYQPSKETKPLITRKTKVIKKEAKALLFSYDPKLIKKDLMKTLLLSFIFIILILTLKFAHLEALFFRQ